MHNRPPQGPLSGLTNGRFLTGAAVGGLVTYVLTNEAVQKAMINGAAQVWMALKGGMEETRERFRDAEAEIKATRSK
ncbi:MAG: hypothetical protein HLUCCA24_00440 [Rhodobacteraceae bacterium HLUCCA24]|nr:MAG: hypothetical protein HLUCCA24_00440 [Rhodobacteraceae bacterium HLUCCA24]